MRKQIERLGALIPAWAPYAVALVFVVLVCVEVGSVYVTGDLDQPGPVHAVADAVEVVEQGVSEQVDRIDGAIGGVLAQLEYICTRGVLVDSRMG